MRISSLNEFYELVFFEHKAILMIAKSDLTPGEIRKHHEQVQKQLTLPTIYVSQSITSYNRDRLIKAGVSFVVPGNQMYLPYLGIDLREYFLKNKKRGKEFLSPASQTLLIYALLREPNQHLFSVELAHQLGYALMTVNRAFDELSEISIGEVHKQGKRRFWHFSGSKKELWEGTSREDAQSS